MVTFKKFLLIKEYTREVMPEIYAALEAYDDPMVGVHFSRGINIKNEIRNKSNRTPHIGLNLNPFHHDPIGIYAFPKDYVLSGKLESNTGFSEFKYFYIVKPSSKARILNLSKLTEDGAAKLLYDMGLDPDFMNNESIYHNSGKTSVGHIFWGVLEYVRKQMSAKGNVSWNILFKDTGYNVLYDEGDGIIHYNEPTQIIYLESSAMEVLDQGEQDNSDNKIYSFFIRNFTELRPEKTKKQLILRSKDNSYTLYVYPPSNGTIEIKIYSEEDYKNKFDVRVNLKDLNEKFVDELRKIILAMNILPRERNSKEVSDILEKISKRFSIKLKSGKNGEMEIRQGYQDSDKNCVIIFRISAYNNKMYFYLNKKDNKDAWSLKQYNVVYDFQPNDEQTPEDIINIGLNGLKENMEKHWGKSHTYATLMAIKTIGFLKKRVFGL